MAVYDFTGANGDPLPSGLTAANGTSEIQNNALAFTGAQPAAPRWVVTFDSPNVATKKATLRNSTTSGIARFYLRYQDLNNSLFLNLDYGNQELSIYTVSSGTYTERAVQAFTLAADTDYIVELSDDGNSIGVDVNGSPAISDVRNTFSTATKSGVGATVDTISVDDLDTDVGYVAPTGINITTQLPRVFQRTSDTSGVVQLAGTFDGNPASIERSIDGGSNWITAIASPSNGVFVDTLTLPVGINEVIYRYSDDVGVTATASDVRVGKVFEVLGQSNASCWGLNNQTHVASSSGLKALLLGNDDNWKELSDPYDSSSNQVDSVSDDGSNPGGSWVVQFANKHLQDYPDMPIAFMPSNKGSTGIDEWQKDYTPLTNGLNLYTSSVRRHNLIGGCECVLWFQWERDANGGRTTRDEYVTKATQMFSDFNTDIAPRQGFLMVSGQQISDPEWDGNGTTTGQVAIRAAQQDIATNINYVYVTSDTTGIDLDSGSGSDGLHAKTDTQIEQFATIIYDSYEAQINNPVIVNQPPTANAGINQSVAAGVTVQLDGSGSTDGDGTIVSYSWAQTAGDAVILTGASTSTPSFTAPSTNAQQTLTFELTVTDNEAAPDTDTVDVVVAAEVVQPIESTLNLTITGISAGSQALKLWSETDNTIVYNSAVTFSGESASITLPVAVGTVVTGRWLGTNPPTTGTGIYGVTV